MRRDRLVEPLEDDRRLHEAARHAALHVGDVAHEVGGKALQPRDVVLVALGVEERHVLGQARQPRMEARVGVERHLVRAELEALDPHLELAAEDVVVDLVAALESVAVDRAELGKEPARLRRVPLQVLERRRAQQMVVLVAADRGREQRARGQPELPLAIEQVVQPLGLFGRLGTGWDKGDDDDTDEDDKPLHRRTSYQQCRGSIGRRPLRDRRMSAQYADPATPSPTNQAYW